MHAGRKGGDLLLVFDACFACSAIIDHSSFATHLSSPHPPTLPMMLSGCHNNMFLSLSSSQNGEQQRGGAASQQARQIPAASSRELRPVIKVRLLWQVVRQHRQGQPAQRLEDPLWCKHIPGIQIFTSHFHIFCVTSIFL